jgi:hypothetical protein
MKQKINTLDQIQRKYDISFELYDEIRKIIRYEHQKTKFDISNFQEELPY